MIWSQSAVLLAALPCKASDRNVVCTRAWSRAKAATSVGAMSTPGPDLSRDMLSIVEHAESRHAIPSSTPQVPIRRNETMVFLLVGDLLA
ncbi:hypothetical protein D3C85_1368910 [compost metagenome]